MQDQATPCSLTFLGAGQALPGRDVWTNGIGNDNLSPNLDSDMPNEHLNAKNPVYSLSQRKGNKTVSKNSSANNPSPQVKDIVYFGEAVDSKSRVLVTQTPSPRTVDGAEELLSAGSNNRTDPGIPSIKHSTVMDGSSNIIIPSPNPGTTNSRTQTAAPTSSRTLVCGQWNDVASDIVDSGNNTGGAGTGAPLTSAIEQYPSFYPVFDPEAVRQHSERIKDFWSTPSEQAVRAFPDFCKLYSDVKSFLCPNAIRARITLQSGLNLGQWEKRLAGYHDNQICAFLRFGWPVGYSAPHPPTSVSHNHPSGNNYKTHVTDFIKTETTQGAMLGPFEEDPFLPWTRKSPIMTRPKKDSVKRRIIIDLTHPEGQGVNSGINIHSVLGTDISYSLPSVWDLIAYIQTLESMAWIWVADLQRAYRQLRVDPLDVPLLGLQVEEGVYLDLCPSFGCRSSSAACQRTSNAVVYLMRQAGYIIYAYLDDYAGCCATYQQAQEAYTYFKHLMKDLGLQLADNKCRPPATKVTWLGYTIDSERMELSVPPEKLNEVHELCVAWLSRSRVNKTSLQSFIGKILHMSLCIRHSRKFTARMLATLRAIKQKSWITIGDDFRADVRWFKQYSHVANGISLFNPDTQFPLVIECDACLTGAGGNSDQHYYTLEYLETHAKKYPAIHQLEALNVLVAVRTLSAGLSLYGKGILVYTDNLSSSMALTSGKTKDPVLAACARQLWLEAAVRDMEIKIVHKPGSLIPLADALSRMASNPSMRQFVHHEVRKRQLLRLPPVLNGYHFFDDNI